MRSRWILTLGLVVGAAGGCGYQPRYRPLVEVQQKYHEEPKKPYSQLVREYGLPKFEPGKSTQAQIKGWLGEPARAQRDETTGEEMWTHYIDEPVYRDSTQQEFRHLTPYLCVETYFQGGVLTRYRLWDLARR